MADAMKLLPCPMCGGEAALLDYEARYGGLHYASRCPQCASCGCSMGYLPTAKKAVEAWNCRASRPAPEKSPSFDDARRKLIHCIEQWDGETEYDAEDIAALADDILDAFGGPPAREEAPAEGAGRPDDYEGPDVGMHDTEIDDRDDDDPELPDTPETRLIYKHFCDVHCLNPDEAADATGALIEDLAALRNRTSEPEAGAVAWRVPSVLQPGLTMFTDAPPKDPNSAEPLYTHPAPATAGKLRVAVESFEKIKAIYRKTPPYHSEAQTIVNQTLAALNEQPQ